MLRSLARVVVLAVAVAILLFGATFVYLGTRLLPELPLLVYIAVLVAVPAVAMIRPLDGRAGPVLGVILLGALVFSFGVYGPTVTCGDASYPDTAGYGIAYDAGVLEFGENTGGTNYRCTASTVPSVALLGYLVVTGGFLAAAFDWHTDPPWADRSFRGGPSTPDAEPDRDDGE